MNELKLHDIKGIVEIPDDSIYYFFATVLLSLIVLGALIWLIYRFVQRKKAVNWHKHYYEKLTMVDLSSSKSAAYEITEYGARLTKDTTQQKSYDDLVALLESYKYKKDVDALSSQAKEAVQTFISSFEKQ